MQGLFTIFGDKYYMDNHCLKHQKHFFACRHTVQSFLFTSGNQPLMKFLKNQNLRNTVSLKVIIYTDETELSAFTL